MMARWMKVPWDGKLDIDFESTKHKVDGPEIDFFGQLSYLFLSKWLEFTNERGRARCGNWSDVTKEELAGYISILLHMSLKKLPEV
ncbi:MAG: hypothetical protein GY816_18890 [Cytophagales bacterium]|nr:hypothetical protein [Cytophagales bacterium]